MNYCDCPEDMKWESEMNMDGGSCVPMECPSDMPFESPQGCHASCEEIGMEPLTRLNEPFKCFCRDLETLQFDNAMKTFNC